MVKRRKSKKKTKKTKRKKKPLRFLIRLGIILLLALIALSVAQVAVVRFVNPPFTMRMAVDYVASLVALEPYQAPDYRWQPMEKISPYLQKAVLASEDQRFLQHKGFDVVELRKAINDMLTGKTIRGASTISMQTARTVYLPPHRNLLRKALEAYYTALLELFWSKRRILEIYLNTVDWGDGLMGADAAARHYFKTSPIQLTQRQAALLAAILPNPHRLSPTRPDETVRYKVRRILRYMPQMPRL